MKKEGLSGTRGKGEVMSVTVKNLEGGSGKQDGTSTTDDINWEMDGKHNEECYHHAP